MNFFRSFDAVLNGLSKATLEDGFLFTIKHFIYILCQRRVFGFSRLRCAFMLINASMTHKIIINRQVNTALTQNVNKMFNCEQKPIFKGSFREAI